MVFRWLVDTGWTRAAPELVASSSPPRLTGNRQQTMVYYIEYRYIEGGAIVTNRQSGRSPEAYLPLPPATFHILLALADGELHGYAIMKGVTARSEGTVRLGPGTLYGALKRLLEAGLVEERGERADPDRGDERRRYYRLTSLGIAVARAEARRLDAMVRAARQKKLLGARPA